MCDRLSKRLTTYLTKYLEGKTQRQFSLDANQGGDVVVDGVSNLFLMYFFRTLHSYEKFYLQGRFETPYLSELLSSLPQKKRVNTYQGVLRNFTNLYSQPLAVIPFLCDHEVSFLGFFEKGQSEKHLEKIGQFLDLNPCDELLEVGLSAGSGQQYLMKKFGCALHSLVFSTEHQLSIENVLQLSPAHHEVTMTSFTEISEVKKHYTKIIINGFFEPLSDAVLNEILSSFKQVLPQSGQVKVYLQGLLSPSFEKVLQEHFPKHCHYEKTYYHREVLKSLALKQDRLLESKGSFGLFMYRSWRLYFAKAHLAMTRWEYLPLSLAITIDLS